MYNIIYLISSSSLLLVLKNNLIGSCNTDADEDDTVSDQQSNDSMLLQFWPRLLYIFKEEDPCTDIQIVHVSSVLLDVVLTFKPFTSP